MVVHRPAGRFRVAFAHGAIDIMMLFSRFLEIAGTLYGFTAGVKQDGCDHVHQRGKNAVIRSGGYSLMKLHVVHQILFRLR